jgi:hypothetical protein
VTGDPLFRTEAVQWARGTRPGDPTRLDARCTRWLFRLLLLVLAAVLAATFLVRLPATIAGPAVLDPAAARVTVTVPAGSDIAPGDRIAVTTGPGDRLDTQVATVLPGDDELVLVAPIPPGAGPPRAGRADIEVGTASLLGTLLDGLRGGAS